MFDAQGMPVPKRFNEKGYETRTGPVPCELSVGCPKGHWKDKPDLTNAQAAVVSLFRAVQATSGRCLTEAERNDWFLTLVFAELYEVSERSSRMNAMASSNKLEALLLKVM